MQRGKNKRVTAQERWRLQRRRQTFEPIIGHLNADHRMNRCHLKGKQGDSVHTALCAAGYTLRWLLHMIARKGIPFLWAIFLWLQKARAWALAAWLGGLRANAAGFG